MPADTSIFDTAPQKPYNPGEVISNALSSASTLQDVLRKQTQNRLLQGNMELNRIIGRNTDNGSTDFNKVYSEASSNPLTAPLITQAMELGNQQNAPQTIVAPNEQGVPTKQFISRQGLNSRLNPTSQSPISQQQPIDQDQIDNAHEHLENVQNSIMDLLNKKGGPNLSDILETKADLVGKYIQSGGKQGISPTEAMAAFNNMPTAHNGKEPTPDQYKQYLQDHLNKVNQTRSALTTYAGPHSSQQIVQQSQQPTNNGNEFPTVPSEVPTGFDKRQESSITRVEQAREEAAQATKALPILNKIYDLSKSGVKTGTNEGFWNGVRSALVSYGVGSDKMATDADAFRELQKFLSANVVSQNGDAKTNQYLDTIKKANPEDTALPQTIQNITQFAKSTAQGSLAKQRFLNNSGISGQDPDKEAKAQQLWSDNYDQRALEGSMLPKEEHEAYFDKLPSADEKKKVLKGYQFLKKFNALPQ